MLVSNSAMLSCILIKVSLAVLIVFVEIKTGFLKRGPRPPLGVTKRFSGGHEQRPSLSSFAVILHNPSVTIYRYIKYSPVKLKGSHDTWKFANHWIKTIEIGVYIFQERWQVKILQEMNFWSAVYGIFGMISKVDKSGKTIGNVTASNSKNCDHQNCLCRYDLEHVEMVKS